MKNVVLNTLSIIPGFAVCMVILAVMSVGLYAAYESGWFNFGLIILPIAGAAAFLVAGAVRGWGRRNN
jgi:hypothetical protein